MGSRTTVTEETALADDHIPLGSAHEEKQPCRDVEVYAREGFFRGQVSPDGIGSKRGQGLVSAEEEFVWSAEERE